ncbi:MAG: ArdC-like ssDNA-binding domain-containing protein [Chloroflexota bacterium]
MNAKQLLQSIEAACETLAKETDQVRISDTLQNYLEMISKFHKYSWHNMLLISIQCPQATRVAGYQSWKAKFQRQVKQGEKGIAILAPCFTRKKDRPEEKVKEQKDHEGEKPEDTPKQKQQKQLYGFRVAYVFDVSQTDGDPLPDCPVWQSTEVNESLQAALLGFAEEKQIEVTIVDDLGGAEGVSMGGRIKLLQLTGTGTFVHELAHELLGHTQRGACKLSAQQCEIEADATAYVVCHHFGLHAANTPNYLALWQASGKDILDSLQRIQEIAAEIIQAVEAQVAPPERRHDVEYQTSL